jgi:hypothetical protein
MMRLPVVAVILLITSGCGGGSSPTRASTPVSPTPVAPASAPVPTPPPNFTGIWRGATRIIDCYDDGVFEGECQIDSATQYGATLILTLVQSGSTVSGNGEWAYINTRVTGTANGQQLALGGRIPVSSTVEAGFEDWDMTMRGNALDGRFTVRHFARQTGVSGALKWTVATVSVLRTP